METVARVHWLGMKAISSDTNAVGAMQIWKMPETGRLESQTLDKLSAAPWRFLRGETNPASTNLLRPLLQDLLDHESYLEIRRPSGVTNAPGEMILAIRLDDQRAGLWETNLGAAIASLTHTSAVPAPDRRWSLKKHHAPNLIELARAGDWTVIGAAQDHNGLLDETLARIQQDHTPVAGPATNLWLDARLDLPAAISAIGRHLALPADVPTISLSVLGENRNVHTRAELNFAGQTLLVLDPWNIATNLIGPNLTSFTAVRGFKPILNASKFWRNLHAGEPPDQICVWAVNSVGPQTYFAAPLPNAVDTVSNITKVVLARTAPWYATSGLVRFRKSAKFSGVEWVGLPYVAPFLESTMAHSNAFVIGGFFPQATADTAPIPILLPQLDQTNLVAYNWEVTGRRIEQLLYMGQFARLVSGREQLPAHSAGLAWLAAAATRLDFSTTRITQTAPGRLSLNRRSGVGFTALELNLLADWLESPDFPFGLHSSLRAPPLR